MINKSSALLILCGLIASISGSLCQAKTEAPQIPLAQLERYKTIIYHEIIESIVMEQIRLVGPKTIQIEVPSDYSIDTNVKQASVAFLHQKAIGYGFNLYSFPQKAFKHKLTDTTLNAYLENLALSYKPKAQFEIIEAAEVNDGRARFRIFGQKALTIRYALNIKEQRIIVAENWAQEGDTIYMISVIGPERSFNFIFKEIRIELNSMHLIKE